MKITTKWGEAELVARDDPRLPVFAPPDSVTLCGEMNGPIYLVVGEHCPPEKLASLTFLDR